MKKVLFSILIVFSLNAFSQGCANPLQFCAGVGYNLPLDTSGNNVSGPQYGCLLSAVNPAFFYFQISNSGNLILDVAGTGGGDVDFVCWGPFSSSSFSCGQLTSGNIVDCSYSTSSTETITVNGAIAGQFYVMCVTNFSGMPQNLFMTSNLNNTAGTTCNGSVCNVTSPSSICFVNTNDSLQNEIYFNHSSIGVKGTIVYRQNAMSVWDSIGYVPVAQSDKFADTVANPNQQAYTYCVAKLDSCDSIRPKSPIHKTLFLQTSLGSGTQINLSWTGYVGTPVASYYIYRGSTPFNMTLINQVSSTTFAYTDLTPPSGMNYYKVTFKAPNCTSNSPHDTLVGSNYRDNSGTTALQYLNISELFSVYPNPAKGNLNIYNYEIARSIEIFDLMGSMVQSVKPKNNLEILNIENLSKGIYFVKITNSKGTFTRKVLVE